jgi:hypothetical protein
MPWPDVHSLAIRVPKPTNSPAAINMTIDVGAGSLGNDPGRNAAAESPANRSPSKNVQRHGSFEPASDWWNIPDIPAIRPFISISPPLASPIIAPPMAA